MPRQKTGPGGAELFQRWKDEGLSYSELARLYNTTRGAVAGAIHRYRLGGAYDLFADSIKQHARPGPSQREFGRMIIEDQKTWRKWQYRQETLRRMTRVMVIQDVHAPYVFAPAVKLAAELAADFQPDIINAGSDYFDFEYIGRWENAAAAYKRIWQDDLAMPIQSKRRYMAMLKQAAPQAVFPFLPGNHDTRLQSYLETNAAGTSDYTMLHFWTDLRAAGVLNLGLEAHEFLTVTPGLKLWHGIQANKDSTAAAKSTLDLAASGGMLYNVVSGHAHRVGEYTRHGVTAWVTGCLQSHNPAWGRGRDMKWSWGVWCGFADMRGRFVKGDNIVFQQYGGELVAFYGPKMYSVSMEYKRNGK